MNLLNNFCVNKEGLVWKFKELDSDEFAEVAEMMINFAALLNCPEYPVRLKLDVQETEDKQNLCKFSFA